MPSASFLPPVRAAVALLTLAATSTASAGTLQVDPIRVEIDGDNKTGTVTVENEEAKPVTIRAYPLAWTQADGNDVYAETAAVIVSPPIFTIPGGGTQLVRVGLRGSEGAHRSFRLIIEEVPQASPGGGIQVALRLNLPLHAMIKEGAKSDIIWAVRRQAGAGWIIEATNRGTGHVRVDAAWAAAATGLAIDPSTSFGVVLPGASLAWPIGTDIKIADQRKFDMIRQATGDGRRQISQSSD